MLDNKFFKYSIGTILILIIIFLLGKVDYFFRPFKVIINSFIIAILAGLLLYYIFRPLVRFLSKQLKLNVNLSILIVILIILSMISMIVFYGGSTIKEQFQIFLNNIYKHKNIISWKNNYIFQNAVGQYLNLDTIPQKVLGNFGIVFKNLVVNTGNVISAIANVGTQIVLIPFVLFFFLKDDKFFVGSFMRIVPKKYKEDVKNILKDIDETLTIYITGQLIVSLVIGILMYIGYKIIGISSPIVLSMIAMVTSIIPILGTFLGILPAIFIGFSFGIPMVIKVLIVLTVVQQLEGHFISPFIIGNRLKIHPLVVVFLVLTSISWFGFIGGFLAVPVFSVLKVTIKDIIKIYQKRLIKTIE